MNIAPSWLTVDHTLIVTDLLQCGRADYTKSCIPKTYWSTILSPNALTTLIIVTGLPVTIVIGLYSHNQGDTPLGVLSAAGSVASLVALAAAIVQLVSIKRLSQATHQAIQDTRRKMTHSLTIIELAKAIKIIEQVQAYITSSNYELARLRLQDLHNMLIQFRQSGDVSEAVDRHKYDTLLTDLSIDMLNLYQPKSDLKAVKSRLVNEHLMAAAGLLSDIESRLRFKEA